jgi:dephospho-CoA kinase
MLIIGICGRIGSGKSEVARVFEEHGAVVISADRIGREVVENNNIVFNSLKEAFGDEIISSDGSLDRRRLGVLAFASELAKAKLDSIVHPPLLDKLRSEIEKRRSIADCDILVVDAALILDWEFESELDILVCVTSSEDQQIKRLADAGLTREEARQRLSSQIPAIAQASRSDFVINNWGSLDDLKVAAERLFEQLRGLEKND